MRARQTRPGVAICLRERLLPQSQTEISLRLCFYQGRLALIRDVPPRGFSSGQAHFSGATSEECGRHLLCVQEWTGRKNWHCGLLRATATRPSRKPPNPLAAPFVKHVAREDSEPRLRKQPLCSLPRSKGPAKGGLCSCGDLSTPKVGSRNCPGPPRNLLSYLLGKFRNRSCATWKTSPSGCPCDGLPPTTSSKVSADPKGRRRPPVQTQNCQREWKRLPFGSGSFWAIDGTVPN